MADALPRKLGPYELVELIGRGGMAEVYRARRDGPGGFVKDLALKRILPRYAGNEQLVQRFQEEARIAAALVHGNVVQVYDFGRLEGEHYIVMEYIDGLPLGTVLDRCAAAGIPLPSPLVGYIGAEACAGLGFAHDLTTAEGRRVEVVHRDVSPQNVMLSYAGDVKIGDFGIAKAADSLIRTEAGLRVGKMSYMSPEQAGGRPLDGRSDLFSMGVTLWEALTLRELLPRGDMAKGLEALSRCEFSRPSEVQRDVPPELDAIVMKALALDPDERFEDGEAMARQLRAYVHRASPGFGRHDVVEYLDWIRPDASRPSTLGPPVPAPVPPTGAPEPARGAAPGKAPRWPWLVLALAPLVGMAAGGATYGVAQALGPDGEEASPAPVVAPSPASPPASPVAAPRPAPPTPAAVAPPQAASEPAPEPAVGDPGGIEDPVAEADAGAAGEDRRGPKPETRRRRVKAAPRNR